MGDMDPVGLDTITVYERPLGLLAHREEHGSSVIYLPLTLNGLRHQALIRIGGKAVSSALHR